MQTGFVQCSLCLYPLTTDHKTADETNLSQRQRKCDVVWCEKLRRRSKSTIKPRCARLTQKDLRRWPAAVLGDGLRRQCTDWSSDFPPASRSACSRKRDRSAPWSRRRTASCRGPPPLPASPGSCGSTAVGCRRAWTLAAPCHTAKWKKRSERRKHCAPKFSPRRRPTSRERGTAKI